MTKKANQWSLVNSLKHQHFINPFIPAIYPVFVVHDVNIVNQPPRRRPLSLNPTRFLFHRYCVILYFFFFFVSLHWVISVFRMFSSVWLLLLPLVLASRREEHKDIVANTRLRLRFLNDFFLSQIRLGFPRPSEIPEKELKFLLMRALQPPIHNQPKMNVGWVVTSFKNTFTIPSNVKHCLVNVCRMEPMIQNWIPLKKRWINIGAHDKHRLEYSRMTKSRKIVLIHLCLRYISKNMVPYTFGVG